MSAAHSSPHLRPDRSTTSFVPESINLFRASLGGGFSSPFLKRGSVFSLGHNHEITDSATYQTIAQVVLAIVDGEPVGQASSKPAAPRGLASPLQQLGETKSIKAGQLLLLFVLVGRIYGRNRFKPFNIWDDFALRLGPYKGRIRVLSAALYHAQRCRAPFVSDSALTRVDLLDLQ